ELRFVDLGERRMYPDTGVVDQVVEPLALPMRAQRVANLHDERIETRAVADVQLQRERATTGGFDRGDHRVGFFAATAIREDHVGALRGQFQRHVAAEAPAAAGDQGDGGGSLHGVFLRMNGTNANLLIALLAINRREWI